MYATLAFQDLDMYVSMVLPLTGTKKDGSFFAARVPSGLVKLGSGLRRTVFLDVYVDEGSRLTKLGDDGLFTLVRTEQGEVGLVRSVHLETWTEDSWKPGYLLALEEMQERSAERRRKAVEGREELGALVDALRPLEALFGGGSLIDPQGSITSRGWAAVAIAIYVPVNAAVYLSNSLRSLTTR
eukprot:CAMPEP_0172585084 /NCGR_PEP_ID=MMETSP1068-20121228/4554_1 /TAXON_ID=35684 /ORGANISM="Pseudopedinella elastica, Strain CCMP716" /LENGTH=183 /DNA_ID=CAMNT_0013379429 /DNA_START=53 /DNA_END=603 /DNA_ORIENTATION=-